MRKSLTVGAYRLLLVLLVGSLAVATLGSTGCSSAPDVWAGKPGPPRVVVSFPPLYSFVKKVGGEHVGVVSLCTSIGPHHYTYSEQDAMKLRRADLFLTNGLGLDDNFTNKAFQNSGNGDLSRLVKLGDRLPEDMIFEGMHFHHEHKEGEPHDHSHENDPHVWMGLDRCRLMVDQIRDELTRVDPGRKEIYAKNAKAYNAELEAIEKEGRAMIMKKKRPRIVTFHESLTYFSDTFGLEIVDVIRKNPGTDPTAKENKELVDVCMREKIRVIAVEPQYPKEGPVKLLVDELKKRGRTDIVVIELDTLETADEKDLSPDWYVNRLEANLAALDRSLE